MQIWIDADACPKAVKEIIFKACQKQKVLTLVVANKAMHVPSSEFIRMIQVAGGPDVADDHIAESADVGDLAITADIPLAARLVKAGVVTINSRGEVYTEENIGERLSMRDFMTDLRDQGVMTGGPSAFGVKERQRFANAFDRELQRGLREER